LVKRKEDFVLLGDTVRERMRSIGGDKKVYPIPLDKATQDFPVTRQFLSSIYGGNTQRTFPEVASDKFAVHGLDDFMYPNLNLNPYAPETSGASGLFFAPSDQPADKWEQVQRVISRLDQSKWQYVGQYKLVPAASLTKDEWASQGAKVCSPDSMIQYDVELLFFQVRNAWAREICERNWGKDTLARIYLRKTLGRAFTEGELAAELATERNYNVMPDDVSQAFLNGEEVSTCSVNLKLPTISKMIS
jgi:hypothetical protein